MFDRITDSLIRFLARPRERPAVVRGPESRWQHLARTGDVLLVEGSSRVAGAVKYLTQSTWSHAALVSDASAGTLIEADFEHGVVEVGFKKYEQANTRLCRPIGLTPEEQQAVVTFARGHIGAAYDVRNIIDLARYLLPTPPVPVRYRRSLLTLGSGDPTEKLICSSLIARAFQSIRYPILPQHWWHDDSGLVASARHYSLLVPRDFDLSPYFAIIKPTVEQQFDFRSISWQDQPPDK